MAGVVNPASPEGMLRSYYGGDATGLSSIKDKPEDDRNILEQVRNYLNKGINEDAYDALGPHAAPALIGLGSLLGELVGPGADVRDAVTASGETTQAVKEGDILGAGVGGLNTLASIAMMALPGSLGGAKKITQEVSENTYKRPVYHSTRKAKEIEDADEIYFVSKNNDADIGFHVASSPLSANQRIILNKSRQDELKNIAEYEKNDPGVAKALKGALDERYANQSNLLLKLKDNINPVRVPDVSNFKNPLSWAETLAVSKKDYPDKFGLGLLKPQKTSWNPNPKMPPEPVIIKHKGDDLLVNREYIQDILEREGKIDIDYIKDLVKMVYDTKDKMLKKGTRVKKLNPLFSAQDRGIWFEQLKELNKKHGYDSFVYKNKYEGVDKRVLELNESERKIEDSLMLMYPNQVKYATAAEFNPNKKQLSKNQGGSVVERNPYANYQSKAI